MRAIYIFTIYKGPGARAGGLSHFVDGHQHEAEAPRTRNRDVRSGDAYVAQPGGAAWLKWLID
jgi:hypothetical protein